MARGDGKAQRGHTRGKGVIRMATGGKPGESAMSQAEASRGVSSSGGYGGQTSRAEAGSSSGGGRSDPRNAVSNAIRDDYLRNADRASARLGPNAAQAMADAGANPDTANYAAKSINRMAGSTRNMIGDPTPGQRMATYNADGSISYSAVPSTVTTQKKQIYDRILPERMFPTSAPVGTLGSFGTPPAPAAPAAPKSPMSVYGDEFSFTPDQTTNALKSLYSARQPGASYNELMGLKAAMQQPANKAMAATLAAPFSSGTRAPMPPESPMRPASTLAGYTGQDQRFPPAPVTKQISDQITPGGIKEIYDRHPDMIEPASAPAGGAKPPSVVAGRQNFGAARNPLDPLREGRRGEGPRRKKKPIIEEEAVTNVRHGGTIRGDGKAAFGKTKGRYI